MKDHLTYGFHPEYDSPNERKALIHSSWMAARDWNEAMGFEVLKFKARNPDILVSEVTKQKVFEVLKQKEKEEVSIVSNSFRKKLQLKMEAFLKSRMFVYMPFALGGCVYLEGKAVVFTKVYHPMIIGHEFGHAFGLPHSTGASIMKGVDSEQKSPTSLDVKAVSALIEAERLGVNCDQNIDLLDWFYEPAISDKFF